VTLLGQLRAAGYSKDTVRLARATLSVMLGDAVVRESEVRDSEWSRRRDLNPRPADYETRAGAKPALSSSAYLRVTALPADTFTRESLVT